MQLNSEQYHAQAQRFVRQLDEASYALAPYHGLCDVKQIATLKANFMRRTDLFFRENRQLNLAVLGQVKVGKSSFLNTLLFDGKNVLPEAATPKTAALTQIEYGTKNSLLVEFYTAEEWHTLEELAAAPIATDLSRMAKEVVGMAIDRGTDVHRCLQQGTQKIEMEDLTALGQVLNDYVGDNGITTPVVKSVVLQLHLPELEGIVVVDTPGLNDPVVSRTEKTKKYLENCDAAFFLSRSGHFLDENDVQLLAQQLPQKGLQRLVLLASLYDEVLLDAIYDYETLEEASMQTKVKLRRHAAQRIASAIAMLKRQQYPPALIDVVEQCRRPLFVSAIAQRMSQRAPETYSEKEALLYRLLNTHGDLTHEALLNIANFTEIQLTFADVIAQREETLARKMEQFVHTASLELCQTAKALAKEVRDKEASLKQTRADLRVASDAVLAEMEAYQAAIAGCFAPTREALSQGAVDAAFALRQLAKNPATFITKNAFDVINDTQQVSDSIVYKPWTWGKKHEEYQVYTVNFTYIRAQDVEKITKEIRVTAKHLWKQLRETVQDDALIRAEIAAVLQKFGAHDAVQTAQWLDTGLQYLAMPVLTSANLPSTETLYAQFPKPVRKETEKNALKTAIEAFVAEYVAVLSAQFVENQQQVDAQFEDSKQYFSDQLSPQYRKRLADLFEQNKRLEQTLRSYGELLEILLRYDSMR